jgi:hypothetical protein
VVLAASLYIVVLKLSTYWFDAARVSPADRQTRHRATKVDRRNMRFIAIPLRG